MSLPADPTALPHRTLKAKLCLVGSRGVGKTSLLRRYVHNTFDDRYLTTIGTKVSKKEVAVRTESGTIWDVDLTVWDIMGEKGFRVLLPEAYFFGAAGILAVADVTRQETFTDIDDWIDGATEAVGPLPVVLAANKSDLPGDERVPPGAAEACAERLGGEVLYTSAKTSLHVDACFQALAAKIVAKHVAARQALAAPAV